MWLKRPSAKIWLARRSRRSRRFERGPQPPAMATTKPRGCSSTRHGKTCKEAPSSDGASTSGRKVRDAHSTAGTAVLCGVRASRPHDRGQGSRADISVTTVVGARHSRQAGVQRWGTCLREMFVGSQGRFSTDLDFTGIDEHDHEEIILGTMQAFEQPFHGIQFAIPDDGYYETQEGVSWAVNPTYSHWWNSGESEIKIRSAAAKRLRFGWNADRRSSKVTSRFLPFVPAEIIGFALPESLSKKIRACHLRVTLVIFYSYLRAR